MIVTASCHVAKMTRQDGQSASAARASRLQSGFWSTARLWTVLHLAVLLPVADFRARAEFLLQGLHTLSRLQNHHPLEAVKEGLLLWRARDVLFLLGRKCPLPAAHSCRLPLRPARKPKVHSDVTLT